MSYAVVLFSSEEAQVVYRSSFFQQLRGQLVKKACVSARSTVLTILQVLLPVIVIVGACFMVLPLVEPPAQPPRVLTMHGMTSPQAVVMADITNVQKVFGIERIPWVLTRLLKNDQKVMSNNF